MTGLLLIAAERQRQIDAEGYTLEHDDQYAAGELVAAAVHYALADPLDAAGNLPRRCPRGWPWHWRWWKPSDDPVRNLVKAGALIAAEIDRQLRLQQTDGGTSK